MKAISWVAMTLAVLVECASGQVVARARDKSAKRPVVNIRLNLPENCRIATPEAGGSLAVSPEAKLAFVAVKQDETEKVVCTVPRIMMIALASGKTSDAADLIEKNGQGRVGGICLSEDRKSLLSKTILNSR